MLGMGGTSTSSCKVRTALISKGSTNPCRLHLIVPFQSFNNRKEVDRKREWSNLGAWQDSSLSSSLSNDRQVLASVVLQCRGMFQVQHRILRRQNKSAMRFKKEAQVEYLKEVGWKMRWDSNQEELLGFSIKKR